MLYQFLGLKPTSEPQQVFIYHGISPFAGFPGGFCGGGELRVIVGGGGGKLLCEQFFWGEKGPVLGEEPWFNMHNLHYMYNLHYKF